MATQTGRRGAGAPGLGEPGRPDSSGSPPRTALQLPRRNRGAKKRSAWLQVIARLPSVDEAPLANSPAGAAPAQRLLEEPFRSYRIADATQAKPTAARVDVRAILQASVQQANLGSEYTRTPCGMPTPLSKSGIFPRSNWRRGTRVRPTPRQADREGEAERRAAAPCTRVTRVVGLHRRSAAKRITSHHANIGRMSGRREPQVATRFASRASAPRRSAAS
jgi:hypothetical protein